MKLLVTGGCGFIGSSVIRHVLRGDAHCVVNLDKLTYAASREALESAHSNLRYHFVQADIVDRETVDTILNEHQPDAIMHLAAESHVDRSIDGPDDFIRTNISGTFVLLEAARAYLSHLSGERRARFRFHHVSTDEVFGALTAGDAPFTESTAYDPRSPYSASKAASDHLARAWFHTYDLPVIISNTTNNYGPWQFPEKLIPLTITKALAGAPLPVYGDGSNQRDWLFVDDHAEALVAVIERGIVGQTYAIGARQPHSNLEVVQTICRLLDERVPAAAPRADLITFVTDRPGHDFRYEIDPAHAERALGWTAAHDFNRGLATTVDWYLANRTWWERIQQQRYTGERLGAA